MVEASEDGLMVTSGTGVILHLNSRSAELDGVTKDMIGRNVEEIERAGYFDRLSPGLFHVRRAAISVDLEI